MPPPSRPVENDRAKNCRWASPTFLLTVVLGISLPGAPLLADGKAKAIKDEAVELPPMSVNETVKGRPWQYVTFDGMEILSRCSDTATEAVLERCHRLFDLLDLFIPRDLRVRFSAPVEYIFSPQDETPTTAQDMVTQFGAVKSPSVIIPEVAGPLGRFAPLPPSRVHYMPNLQTEDRDTYVIFAMIDEDRLNASTLYLTTSNIEFLLRRRIPSLPDWYVSGAVGMAEIVSFGEDRLEFKAQSWVSEEETEALKKKKHAPPKLLPLSVLFDSNAVDSLAGTPDALRWKAESMLFLRWALDERNGIDRETLWKFIARGSLEPITEDLFRQYFKLGYIEASEKLNAYLPTAVSNSLILRGSHFTPWNSPKFRLATKTEVSRIRGDWERMEVEYVRKNHPEYVERYIEQARQTFAQARERGDGDPRLAAVAGLFHCDLRELDQARPLLEAAANAKVVRPSVYVQLGRVRFLEAMKHPEGTAGLLSSSQANTALAPLAIERLQNPPLQETYELAADVWAHSEAKLGAAQFAFIDEGLRLFPKRPQLLYLAAYLKAAHGQINEARALTTRGLSIVPIGELHNALVQLQEKLSQTNLP